MWLACLLGISTVAARMHHAEQGRGCRQRVVAHMSELAAPDVMKHCLRMPLTVLRACTMWVSLTRGHASTLLSACHLPCAFALTYALCHVNRRLVASRTSGPDK